MNPISDQALRITLDHETTSIVRQLQADNERLRNELARAKANLGNRYLRSVLNLIDKHRDMGFGSLDVIDDCLVLHDENGDSEEMLEQLYRFPLEDKLLVIPALLSLGYWVMREYPIDRIDSSCPFTVHWNHTEEKIRRVYYDFFKRGGILHRPH